MLSIIKRIRPTVGSAHAIAILALFAALGGGYAAAFSGSGQLQKGAMKNVPVLFATVRSLDGIGSIQARCESAQVSVRFLNSSGHTLVVHNDGGQIDPIQSSVPPGGFVIAPASDPDTMRYHIWREGNKRPQADVTVSIDEKNFCTNAAVNVLALNTQE